MEIESFSLLENVNKKVNNSPSKSKRCFFKLSLNDYDLKSLIKKPTESFSKPPSNLWCCFVSLHLSLRPLVISPSAALSSRIEMFIFYLIASTCLFCLFFPTLSLTSTSISTSYVILGIIGNSERQRPASAGSCGIFFRANKPLQKLVDVIPTAQAVWLQSRKALNRSKTQPRWIKLIQKLPRPIFKDIHRCNRCKSTETTKQTLDQYFSRIVYKPKIFTFSKTHQNVYKNLRHLSSSLGKSLQESGNIEPNPGPRPQPKQDTDLKVITYNVRGLNDEFKLRHLVNNFYQSTSKNVDFIACLQETYIENPGKLPYLWRGNFHLTEGLGNRLGCITLLSSHLNIIHTKNFQKRAHLLVCQKSNELQPSYIVVNLYAPNPNNAEKIAFYEDILNEVLEAQVRFDCYKLIIVGDFNLTFHQHESKNRNYLAQERNVAQVVRNFLGDLNVVDIWENKVKFTWRRPNTDCFSAIDHIFYSKDSFELCQADTDWSLSMSDHAAVVTALKTKSNKNRSRSRIPRLDPSILQGEAASEVKNEISAMINQASHSWDPHMKLEYSKMCIRTVMEKAQADRKTREANEEELLNTELDLAVKTLEGTSLRVDQVREIIKHVEDLRTQKTILIEKKGKRLAERLGTKWYNEGEKSTKYFLGLLKRPTQDNFVTITNETGTSLTEEKDVENEIVNFYKRLYENYDNSNLRVGDDTFFDEIIGLSDEDARSTTEVLNLEELGKTLDSCSDSTPGPDGISYSILRNLWQIMGPIISDAWRHSLATSKLAPSHKISFLKLIPKVGKDLKLLTNWMPITLSNCDHKIITKSYAIRLSEKLKNLIEERQTAYLKGRLINDNIRSLISTIKVSNLEDNINGLIVSLDAKKAFDSVEHSFIEQALCKFGLSTFVPVFKLLYNDLTSDIVINGRIVKGFKICRGVKQGDALSCILFIICMEPLLRNINKNVRILSIKSEILNEELPKTYAYADDVSAVIENNDDSLQQLFVEYERLTRAAGLELNADKTELLPIISNNLNIDKTLLNFRINYCNRDYDLSVKEKMKVNGILLQQNLIAMKDDNVEEICRKMEKHLKTWSVRQLSILGRILICKTYGISQVIFLMQSINLCDTHIKKINAILYKFIWNRHFMAAKAPERIKREIVNKSIKLGGLGMLDIAELDASLKIKALGRMLGTRHPFLSLIKDKIDLSDFVHPKILTQIEEVATAAVAQLQKVRTSSLANASLDTNLAFVQAIKNVRIHNSLSKTGRLSLNWHAIRQRGKRLIGELTAQELDSIKRFFNPDFATRAAAGLRINTAPSNTIPDCIMVAGRFKSITTLTSRQIRRTLTDNLPIVTFKIGPILTPTQSLSWSHVVNKLTSTKHKDIIIRLAHGELYSKDRLARHGLIDNATCPRCNQTETLSHKYFYCSYVSEIWRRTMELTNKLRLSIDPNESTIDRALGCTNEPNITALTVHAEIIMRIRNLRDEDANLLLLPRLFVKNATQSIWRRELNRDIKTSLNSIFNN